VDELHAAIVAHLRAQRRHLAATGDRESAIMAIWRERGPVPHCRYCGTPIGDRDVWFPVEELLLARACAAHHNRY